MRAERLVVPNDPRRSRSPTYSSAPSVRKPIMTWLRGRLRRLASCRSLGTARRRARALSVDRRHPVLPRLAQGRPGTVQGDEEPGDPSAKELPTNASPAPVEGGIPRAGGARPCGRLDPRRPTGSASPGPDHGPQGGVDRPRHPVGSEEDGRLTPRPVVERRAERFRVDPYVAMPFGRCSAIDFRVRDGTTAPPPRPRQRDRSCPFHTERRSVSHGVATDSRPTANGAEPITRCRVPVYVRPRGRARPTGCSRTSRACSMSRRFSKRSMGTVTPQMITAATIAWPASGIRAARRRGPLFAEPQARP